MSEQLQSHSLDYITIVWLQETTDGSYCYTAFHPELPTVISQGDTAEEAEKNLAEATELAIAHLVSSELPIPEPLSLAYIPNGFPVAESEFPRSPSVASSGAHYKSGQETITVPSGRFMELVS